MEAGFTFWKICRWTTFLQNQDFPDFKGYLIATKPILRNLSFETGGSWSWNLSFRSLLDFKREDGIMDIRNL